MPTPGVPDLLFEDVREARVEALRPLLYRTEGVGAGFPLHRVTVFLTYGCNLRCPYCKTIARSAEEVRAAPQKRATYTPAGFAALLEGLGDMPIEHLHFTGGEAALVPGVVEMVAQARAAGVAHVSMTSNGTASSGHYVALVEAGLTELRLSLDARDETLGAQLTGREGAWTRTVQTFREVAAAREAGAKVRLIANVVVGRANREALVPLVTFLLSLRPDDVKLITEVDARDELGDFPGRAEVLRGLEAVLATVPGDALPLLRRKLSTVFAVDAIGLPGGRSAAWRCWVPLTERTVDGVAVYPCSVYLREGGAPLAQLGDPAEVQREKTRAWVDAHACGEDPVCRRYCLHCTRRYNDEVNEARVAQTLAWLEAGPPALPPGRLTFAVCGRGPRAASAGSRARAARTCRAPPASAARPFLLLTPLGLEDPELVATLLAAGGAPPVRVSALADYPRASIALYTRHPTLARVAQGLGYEAAWRRRSEAVCGEVWELDDATFARAWALKPAWRKRWPAQLDGALRLRGFHLPDPEDLARQWAWLEGLRLATGEQHVSPQRPEPGEHHPEDEVDRVHPRSGIACLVDRELLPQGEVLEHQRAPRREC